MGENPLRVAVIVGSARQGRFGEGVARWLVSRAARRRDLALDLVDLAALDLPFVYPAEPDDLAWWGRALRRARKEQG